MGDKLSKTYRLPSTRPPASLICIDLATLAKAGIVYHLGHELWALSTLIIWAVFTTVIAILVALKVRDNRRTAAVLEAHGYRRALDDDQSDDS